MLYTTHVIFCEIFKKIFGTINLNFGDRRILLHMHSTQYVFMSKKSPIEVYFKNSLIFVNLSDSSGEKCQNQTRTNH